MSYFYQPTLFTFEDFASEYDDNTRLVMVLSALLPGLEPLIAKFGRERRGRRNDYPVRVMMQSFIASYVYQIPVKNELIRELRRNGTLRRLVGIGSIAKVPKAWQYSKFIGKLARDENLELLESCFHDCVEGLMRLLPGFGRHVGIDGTSVRSWSSGHNGKKTGVPSDPEAAG